MDTRYCGHDFGVVAIKDAHRKNVLWRKFIYRNERIADYLEGVKYLEDNELEIIGIVCDGLRGLIKSLGAISCSILSVPSGEICQIKTDQAS